jgi:Glyoxalase superfamily protein
MRDHRIAVGVSLEGKIREHGFFLTQIIAMSRAARLRVMMREVREFHRELSTKGYRYTRPGLETTEWGTIETGAIDPFGNMLRFCERIESADPSKVE